ETGPGRTDRMRPEMAVRGMAKDFVGARSWLSYSDDCPFSNAKGVPPKGPENRYFHQFFQLVTLAPSRSGRHAYTRSRHPPSSSIPKLNFASPGAIVFWS